MDNAQQRFQTLLRRYFDKTATPEEREEFFALVRTGQFDAELSAFVSGEWETFDLSAGTAAAGQAAGVLEHILRGGQTEAPVRRIPVLRRVWVRYAAAAALLLGVSAYLWKTQRPVQPPVAAGVRPEENFAPGHEGAVLTLADRSEVLLDSAGNGLIATQHGTEVMLQDGTLTYEGAPNEVAFNTMRTPRGRQFRLTLPDGSKVWLNAASAITYPTAFTGGERNVEIEGEAYFEVSGDAAKPFRIKTGEGAEVEVLGTRFNISAYRNDEDMRTTLVEGAVRVTSQQRSRVLAPGQQAIVTARQLKVEERADITKALAWKNGLFDFSGMPLQTVLRQLERWYDIEVEYRGAVKNIEFYGKIDRNASLNSILRVLKASGADFRQEGRKLIMLP
ncbi:FecR family protein [Chitinophaga sp. GCM10012297]|uniref:FecR domain-containing protein n=1 Tax=Chitinophaga chungangae TaxID=2821488 RepID=A0ABS3YA43_9BACT|nr:FecR family protein [Chitinophaga chungangae]MBO9151360.1 FecR domain-containing protein [Chitinophaga chungangae]